MTTTTTEHTVRTLTDLLFHDPNPHTRMWIEIAARGAYYLDHDNESNLDRAGICRAMLSALLCANAYTSPTPTTPPPAENTPTF